MKLYCKVWFESELGETSRLVIDSEYMAAHTLVDLANVFPPSEAMHLGTGYRTLFFETWQDAFDADPGLSVGKARIVRLGRVNRPLTVPL